MCHINFYYSAIFSKVEVRIKFHSVPGIIPGLADCAPNELVIRVQPDQRIFWKITSKVPGLDFTVETRRMDLLYASNAGTSAMGSEDMQEEDKDRCSPCMDTPRSSNTLGHLFDNKSSGSTTTKNKQQRNRSELPGAYERLILEVLRGDQTNFVHADELIASWRIFTPALHEMAKVCFKYLSQHVLYSSYSIDFLQRGNQTCISDSLLFFILSKIASVKKHRNRIDSVRQVQRLKQLLLLNTALPMVDLQGTVMTLKRGDVPLPGARAPMERVAPRRPTVRRILAVADENLVFLSEAALGLAESSILEMGCGHHKPVT